MKRTLGLLVGVLALAGWLWVGSAGAATVDFRTGTFAPADGLNTFSTTVNGISLTINAISLPGQSITNGQFFYDPADGLGIERGSPSGDEADEVDNPEVFQIVFQAPTSSVYVDKILITDLFIESAGYGTYAEQGLWSTDLNLPLAQWNSFQQTDPSAPNGIFWLNINQTLTNLYFTAIPDTVEANHDFSIAKLKGLEARVPEPSTYGLLGSFLVAAYVLSVRRRKQMLSRAS